MTTQQLQQLANKHRGSVISLFDAVQQETEHNSTNPVQLALMAIARFVNRGGTAFHTNGVITTPKRLIQPQDAKPDTNRRNRKP